MRECSDKVSRSQALRGNAYPGALLRKTGAFDLKYYDLSPNLGYAC